jgi:peptide chain release factor 1
MSGLLESISVFEDRAKRLEQRLADPAVASAPGEYAQIAKELAGLRPLVDAGARYRTALAQSADARALESDPDPEVSELARAERETLEARTLALERELRLLLVPKDPNDEKNVMLEVRAGTGGDEAALFAAELLRMYTRYAERRGWKLEPLSISHGTAGGVKEAVVAISGDRVYSRLKYERGVHRVQRVPTTEAQGRIHTSTVTVAVLPEAEEVDVQIDAKDLRVDTFCSSGPGGQSVNTTYSAVRITHIPTGLVVSQQDEKSQIKNRAKAMKVLRSRLYEMEMRRQQEAIAKDRRTQVGTGDRSEKIRTYNFKENRVTDHRFGYSMYQLANALDGDIGELIDQAVAHYQSEPSH